MDDSVIKFKHMQYLNSRLISRVCASLLLLFGSGKMISSLGSDGILLSADPVIGVTTRQLLIGAGIYEIAVGLFILFVAGRNSTAHLLAFTFTVFSVYKVFLHGLGGDLSCPCLGEIAGLLSLNNQQVNIVSNAALLVLGGSAGLLMYQEYFHAVNHLECADEYDGNIRNEGIVK